MKIIKPHGFTQIDAVRRVKSALAEALAQHSSMVSDVNETWDGPVGKCSFKCAGFKVSASVAILPKEVILEGNIPFALLPFKRKIQAVLEESMTKVLS